MSTSTRPHRITERCLAYSPRSRPPWQCKHCGQLFHTKNSALDHECAWMIEKRSDAAPQPTSPQATASTSKQET